MPYRYRFRPRYIDCDAQRVMHNANYLAYVDDAVDCFVRDALGDFESVGFDFMLKKATIEWQAPARHNDWIDVDVTTYVVRLMDGENVVQEIAPVAVGAQIDTGAYASTQTGLFYVFNKVEGLAYDPPYDTYISHWVGFDPDKANGFHSFLKDKDGKVVDASTGRVSNGCIRTGAPEAIFAFAQIGTPVWVHV